MRPIAQIISWIALAATILPSLLYLNGSMELPTVKTWMLVATVVWFAATPLWMDRKTS
jgi:hypothetical protein